METIINLPPPIIQQYDPFLLFPWVGRLVWLWELQLKAKRKIRPQDIGRRKEFEELEKAILEEYERYKKKETFSIEKIEAEAQRRFMECKEFIRWNSSNGKVLQ